MKTIIAFLLFIIAFGWVGVIVALVAVAILVDLAIRFFMDIWPWALALILVFAAIEAIPFFFKTHKP